MIIALSRKGLGFMTVYQAMSLMIAFATLCLLISNQNHKK